MAKNSDVRSRKINYYILKTNIESINVNEPFRFILEKLNDEDKTKKKMNLTSNRFGYLDYSIFQQNITKILFKTASHSFRPPLLDKNTLNERDNPKTLVEGESLNSHIVSKFSNEVLYLFVENFKGCIGIKNFVTYLNINLSNSGEYEGLKFEYDIIANESFLEEMNKLERITCADIIYDKSILGSEALNVSPPTTQIKDEIVLSVKPNKSQSVKQVAIDAWAKFNKGETKITRIRVLGRNRDNNEVGINTSFLEKKETIRTRINVETGVINTQEIFAQIISIANEY